MQAHPVNATLGDGHYSAEQLAFLNRKRSGVRVMGILVKCSEIRKYWVVVVCEGIWM